MPLSAHVRTLLSSTPLALGGAPLGNLFRVVGQNDARAAVEQAWRGGVRYFDTAPHYGSGVSEERIGAAVREFPRHAFALSTKVGRVLEPDANAPSEQHGYVDVRPYTQRFDYTGEGFEHSLEDSRARLGMAQIDVVLIHDVDVATHGAEQPRHFRDMLADGLPALAELRRAGAIGGYGLGVNDVGICLQTLERAELDVILLAGRYTLADQSALDVLLPQCSHRDVAVIAAAPFNSGILATGARPGDGSAPYFDYAAAPAPIVKRVAAIEALCAEFDVPLKAAALQFPRAHPAVLCVLVGARSAREIEESLTFARHPIPRAFWLTLRAKGLVAADAPLPGDRA